jgi:hypothetical protein
VPLRCPLNFGLEVSQSRLHPLNVFIVIFVPLLHIFQNPSYPSAWHTVQCSPRTFLRLGEHTMSCSIALSYSKWAEKNPRRSETMEVSL